MKRQIIIIGLIVLLPVTDCLGSHRPTPRGDEPRPMPSGAAPRLVPIPVAVPGPIRGAEFAPPPPTIDGKIFAIRANLASLALQLETIASQRGFIALSGDQRNALEDAKNSMDRILGVHNLCIHCSALFQALPPGHRDLPRRQR